MRKIFYWASCCFALFTPLSGEAALPAVKSASALVLDQKTGAVLFQKNADDVVSIASITKLMTAMVVLDSRRPLSEALTVTRQDVDGLRGSRSRLPVGTRLNRLDLLRIALMASENRAAHALGRYHPGGVDAFVRAMNAKARALGLEDTRFADPTGLSADNVSSARDLARLVAVSSRYPLIREASTLSKYTVSVRGRPLEYVNTNVLVRNGSWDIRVSKTGYIEEAGKCLVMQAQLATRPVVIVLLDSWGRLTRIGDANRIRRWLEQQMKVAGRAGHTA